MKLILKLISYIGLALTIVPSAMVMLGMMETGQNIMLAGIGMVCWFGSAPFWINMGKKEA